MCMYLLLILIMVCYFFSNQNCRVHRRNLLLIHTTSVTVRYEGIRLDYIKTFSHPFVYFRYILPILFEGATAIVW
jgi:hypothetical protein